jgi:hypothetical protein
LLLIQVLISKIRELLRLLMLPPKGFYGSQGRGLAIFKRGPKAFKAIEALSGVCHVCRSLVEDVIVSSRSGKVETRGGG